MPKFDARNAFCGKRRGLSANGQYTITPESRVPTAQQVDFSRQSWAKKAPPAVKKEEVEVEESDDDEIQIVGSRGLKGKGRMWGENPQADIARARKAPYVKPPPRYREVPPLPLIKTKGLSHEKVLRRRAGAVDPEEVKVERGGGEVGRAVEGGSNAVKEQVKRETQELPWPRRRGGRATRGTKKDALEGEGLMAFSESESE